MMTEAKIQQSRNFDLLLAVLEAVCMAAFLLAFASPLMVVLQMPTPLYLLIASILFPVGICRLLMEAAQKFIFYILGWLVLLAGSVGAFYALGLYYGIACSAAACLIMIVQRLIPQLQGTLQPGWFRVVIMVIMFFVSTTASPESVSVVLYSTMVYVLCKFLWSSLTTTDTFIQNVDTVSYVPDKQIRTMGVGMAIIYSLVVGAVMFACSFLPLDGFFLWIGRLLFSILSWFFSLFSGGDKDKEIIVFPEHSPNSDDTNALPGASDPSWFALLTEKIFTVLMIVILVAVVVIGIGYLVFKLYKNFYEKEGEREEKREFILPFIKEEKLSKEKGNAVSRWSRDPAAKIRKLYKRKIQGKLPKKQKPLDSSTPKEQLASVKIAETPESGEFRNLYEKARYGKVVTPEEAEQMRAVFNKL